MSFCILLMNECRFYPFCTNMWEMQADGTLLLDTITLYNSCCHLKNHFFNTSAVHIYNAVMDSMYNNKAVGSGERPSRSANGRYGNSSVRAIQQMPEKVISVAGLLFVKLFRVRITKRISSSVKTDSTNHPV